LDFSLGLCRNGYVGLRFFFNRATVLNNRVQALLKFRGRLKKLGF
jgi:hypothetical protein